MANTNEPKQTVMYFCTYRNAETKAWRKSREYKSMRDMLAAMFPYLQKHPQTTVTFQTRTVWA